MKFKVINPKKIRKAYEFQLENSPNWTFFQEREFWETKFHNGFNFLILFYSLFISGFVMAKDREIKIIILSIGFLMSVLMFIYIYRFYFRVIILSKIIYNLGNQYTLPFMYEEVKSQGLKAGFPVDKIIGIIIPLFMNLTFLIGIIALILNISLYDVKMILKTIFII